MDQICSITIGLFCREREPHPAVAEIKYLQQPVDMFVSGSQHDCITVHVAKNRTRIVSLIEQDSSSPVSLQVRNRYVFRDLSHLSWAWKLVSDRSQEALLEGRAANENDISSIDLNPATRKVRELEELPRGASCNGYFLNIEGFLNAKQSWADAGHPIVAKQFSVQFIFEEDPPVPRNDALAKPELEPLKLQETLETIQISNGNSDPFVVFDKFTGGIKSIKWGDTDILCGDGLNPNFTRATTDNDRGGECFFF